jgi:hypothetical protein
MKTSLIIIVTLFALLAFTLYNRHSLNQQLQTTIQSYQDSLQHSANSLQLNRDTLAYHQMVVWANKYLLDAKYEEAVRQYKLADSTMLLPLRWTSAVQNFIAAQHELKTNVYNMREEISKLEETAVLNRGFMGELENEAREHLKAAEALKDSLFKMSVALNEIVLENQMMEEKIETIRSSYGKLQFLNTEGVLITYYGEIADGKASGIGIGIVEKKGIYEGEWKDNLRHGKGKYTWANGDVYEGDFLEGKRSGYGRYLFVSGEKYEGEWKNDLREGKGVIYSKDGKVLLDGIWVNDKFKKES